MASTAPSAATTDALWPVDLPELRLIHTPVRLWVPLASRDGAREIIPLSPGTRVAGREALTAAPAEASHVPIAPLAGTIGSTRQVSLTNGRAVHAVELIVDHETAHSGEEHLIESSPHVLMECIDFLSRSGVAADRHYSPDLMGQLNDAVMLPVNTVICTILDTDVSMRLLAGLGARYAEDIVVAIVMLSRMLAARRPTIAIETYAKPHWVDSLREATRSTDVRLVELANDYPQADPTLMCYTLAGRRLRPSELPTQQHVLLLDAAAALAIGQALHGRFMIRTPLALHDHIHRKTYFLWVPIGTPLRHVLDDCGISPEHIILRAGDFLRDQRISADSIVSAGELILHASQPELPDHPDPCIRCGWCQDICPTRVHPAVILDAAQRRDAQMAARGGIHACVECGLCTHVCPSRLPLLDAIRQMQKIQPASE